MNRSHIKGMVFFLGVLSIFLFSACVEDGSDYTEPASTQPTGPNPLFPGTTDPIGARDIQISWAQNNEVGVNQTSGGYKIYFLNAPTDLITAAILTVDIPYVSGAAAPTTYTANFAVGQHYFKIQAYSAIGGKVSLPTQAYTIYVP